MYIPKAYRNDDAAQLVGFMREHSFATLVSIVEGAPFASHIPLVVTVDDQAIRLTGHLAKANPQWHAFGEAESLAIFSGPHAYVSPALYTQHESVPTWNYIAVHAYGVPVPIMLDDQPERTEAMLATMIATYEQAYQQQWDELPAKYRSGMMQGIVGFELVVSRLEGKYKLSQNRSALDQHTVAAALHEHGDAAAREIGAAMEG
ncbi:MAG: FMN-binding negative transcriptional regulator [Roseiflexaceae bacterium]|nr:FMN-binding negative transcriptional regulator [Roseiflexaceae bacterium]